MDGMPISPAKGKNKRPADDMDDPNGGPSTSQGNPSTGPQILRRHRHRRRNIAATVWGPSIPPLAPTSDIPYHEPFFNVYKAILRHPNLFFQFAIRLPPATITDLYAIDKEFHYRFNKYSTSIIHDYAVYHAGPAAYIFSWILFPDLCISDPMLRPMDGRPHLARDIPSLRWTKMVMWRENVVRGILTRLALEGHRMPRQTHTMLMKYWLLIEMQTTASRLAFLAAKHVWSDMDIMLFHLFLVKLDMRFTDPIVGNGMGELSHLLLAQKSLTLLCYVLAGKKVLDYDDVTDMLVKTYTTNYLDIDAHPWLDDELENGVPLERWGLLCKEHWTRDGANMEPAVDLVIKEGINRGLNAQQWLVDFVLYGYVDPETGENVPIPAVRRVGRNVRKTVLPKEGWPLEDVRVAKIRELDGRYGAQEVQSEKTRGAQGMVATRQGDGAPGSAAGSVMEGVELGADGPV